MSSETYHEPYERLSDETKDLHRALVSLQEELDAVDWYRQRADVADAKLGEILLHNMREEMEHAAMLLEWIRRTQADFAGELEKHLFTEGSIVHERDKGEPAAAPTSAPPGERVQKQEQQQAVTPADRRVTVGALQRRG